MNLEKCYFPAMRRVILYLVAVGLATASSAEIPVTDSTIIPGERVGPIQKGMTLEQVKDLAEGHGEIKELSSPLFYEKEIHRTMIFGGTGHEVNVVSETRGEGAVLAVFLAGADWKPPFDLRKDLSPEEVEKANGKPFRIYAFNWGMGGGAELDGGKLSGKIMLIFDRDLALTGMNQWFSSDTEKVRKSATKVQEIGVIFQAAAPPPPKEEGGAPLAK
ncbi:MAG: hypothetical protein JWO82_3730 [Akkermansiaceae bacterium]|nr:hypothetical protein [Akkermansiaceae bacterium]